MKYVPAEEIEKVVLKKLKEMSTDKDLIKKIVSEANKNTESTLRNLKKDRRSQENNLAPVKEAIQNIMNVLSQGKGLKKSKSIAEELNRLEIQKEQI